MDRLREADGVRRNVGTFNHSSRDALPVMEGFSMGIGSESSGTFTNVLNTFVFTEVIYDYFYCWLNYKKCKGWPCTYIEA